jgi:hypothetical protein
VSAEIAAWSSLRDLVHAGRAFARLRGAACIAVRAASGGAISGPNSATLATSFGCAPARCWHDDRAHRVAEPVRARDVQPRADAQQRIDVALDRQLALDALRAAAAGRSMRITRCRASAGISGVQVLELPPRPCTQTTAGPSPSSSTAIRSISWKPWPQLEPVLDDADAVDLDAHHVAAFSHCGGFKPMPTPAGVPGGDHVAGVLA